MPPDFVSFTGPSAPPDQSHDVARLEPVKAAIWIIGSLLLGEEKREPEPLRQRRPSRPAIKTSRTLSASVEDNHQGAICGNVWGQIGEHSQGTGVGAEVIDLL